MMFRIGRLLATFVAGEDGGQSFSGAIDTPAENRTHEYFTLGWLGELDYIGQIDTPSEYSTHHYFTLGILG